VHWFPVIGGSILFYNQLKDAARSLRHLQLDQRWGTLRRIPRVPPDCEGAGISCLEYTVPNRSICMSPSISTGIGSESVEDSVRGYKLRLWRNVRCE
jgi:hypothetical protein